MIEDANYMIQFMRCVGVEKVEKSRLTTLLRSKSTVTMKTRKKWLKQEVEVSHHLKQFVQFETYFYTLYMYFISLTISYYLFY